MLPVRFEAQAELEVVHAPPDRLEFPVINVALPSAQISGVFLTYMTWDSVLLENTTQLFSCMLLVRPTVCHTF